MGQIHLLDKSVYELIAAGEVIERPSSVVKEMLENSIDAGATNIVVEIKNGGRTYLRITDNGCGMSSEDIPLAFVRHATSKIESKDDLSGISTLGFRGEALASVCAVSKVEVLSKRREDSLGTHYVIEGGEEIESESVGCPDGTTFVIRELFYNVPARLKFLKKDVSEGNAIANILQKLALSRPEISFKFIRDNKSELMTSGDGKLLSAIRSVLGKDFYSASIPVNYSYNGVRVSGYVTKPLMSKANRAYQNFFVNNRYVKSVTCMVALEEAYRNRIMTGKFPGCVLCIDLNSENIDVNVHPAKIEIRFSDEKSVYDAVYFAVQNCLLNQDKPAEMIVEEKPVRPTLTQEQIFAKPVEQKPMEQIAFVTQPRPASQIGFRIDTPPKTEYQTMPPVIIEQKPEVVSFEEETSVQTLETNSEPVINTDGFKYINSSSFGKQAEMPAEVVVEEEPKPEIKVVGEVFKTYIVCQSGDDMYLIDKHAAHERYNFERMTKGLDSFEMQTLLDPITVSISYEGYDALRDNQDVCARMGFGVKLLKAPKIYLYGVPVLIGDDAPADLLVKFSDSLSAGKIGSGWELFDDLFHSIACKASVKANSLSDKSELEELARIVFNENIRYCPNGRPALIKLNKYEIEKMFKRIV